MEDLEYYLENFVEPTIAEFEANPTSVRHAFLACVATFHAVDYLAFPRRPRSLREEWRRKSDAFRIVDDVAHAFKHVRSGNPARVTLTSREIVAKSGAFNSAAFGPAFYIGSVTIEGRPEVSVLHTVRKAGAIPGQSAARVEARAHPGN